MLYAVFELFSVALNYTTHVGIKGQWPASRSDYLPLKEYGHPMSMRMGGPNVCRPDRIGLFITRHVHNQIRRLPTNIGKVSESRRHFLPCSRKTFKCLIRRKLPNLLDTGTSGDSIRFVNQVRVRSPVVAAGYLLLDSHVNHENTQLNHTTWFVRPKRQSIHHPPCRSHVRSSHQHN